MDQDAPLTVHFLLVAVVIYRPQESGHPGVVAPPRFPEDLLPAHPLREGVEAHGGCTEGSEEDLGTELGEKGLPELGRNLQPALLVHGGVGTAPEHGPRPSKFLFTAILWVGPL